MAVSNGVAFNLQNDEIESGLLLIPEEGIAPDVAENAPQQSWSSRLMGAASVVVPTAAVGAFASVYSFTLRQATVTQYLDLPDVKLACLNQTTTNTLSEYYSAGYNFIPCPAMSDPWNLPAPIASIPESPVAEMNDPFRLWDIAIVATSMVVGYGIAKYRQHYRQSVARIESDIAACEKRMETFSEQVDADEEECFDTLGDEISVHLKDPITMSSYAIAPLLFAPSGNTYSDNEQLRKFATDPLTREPITAKYVDHTMFAVTNKAFLSCNKENRESIDAVAVVDKMKIAHAGIKEKEEFFLSMLYAIGPIPPLAIAAFSLTTEKTYTYLSQVALPDACNAFLVASNYTYGTSAAYEQGVEAGAENPHGYMTCYYPIKSDPLRHGAPLERHSNLLVMPGIASAFILLSATTVISIPLVLFVWKNLNVASLRNVLCTNNDMEALQVGEALPLAAPQQQIANYGSIAGPVDHSGDAARRALLLRFAMLLCDDSEPALWCPVAKRPFILLALAEVIQQEHKEESKEEQKSASVSQIGQWQGLLFCGRGRAFDRGTVLANPAISDASVCPCDDTKHTPPNKDRRHYTATGFFETLSKELRGNGVSAAEVEQALSRVDHVAVQMG